MNYKEWLFKKVDEEFMKEDKSSVFQTGLVQQEMETMTVTKENIRRSYSSLLQKKEKIRRIESTNERTVHFILNPNVPCKITPFTRKYKRLLEGNLQEFEDTERERFDKYVEALDTETLAEDEKYPVVYENNPFFQLELTGLSRISFAVADDPFAKSQRQKYYPEVYLVNKKSDIKAVISGPKSEAGKYTPVFEYAEDFREGGLKVNDDRKVKINLGELMKTSKKQG